MEKIFCTAPIGLAELKRKFKEDVEFVIDYDNSRFKGTALITYLSNLDITVSLQVTDPEAAQLLLADYMNITAMVKIADLEHLAMNVLLAYTNRPYRLPFDPGEFLVKHRDTLERWTRRLYSVPLYAMYSMGTDHYEYVFNSPEDKDDSVVGLNWPNLIKHPMFAVFIANVPESQWSWNKMFFTDYVFAGNNLFNYFAVPENPLFIALLAMTDEAAYKELLPVLQQADAEAAQVAKELGYVPSV